MPKLDELSEVLRNTLVMFPCLEYEDTPWTPMRKPLSDSRLALVTSAGLHVRGDQPFIHEPSGGGDPSYRVIPRAASPADILQSHVSIGFDHSGIYRDINVTFPVDRLQELVDQRVIGSLSDNNYSFMGALRDLSQVVEKTGPQVAQRMLDDGVEVALLTPT